MTDYLFMATIPSIGKFITSSRKTEDIWAGSILVAQLIKTLLKDINGRLSSKIELIFPAQIPSKDSDYADISNKILLIFQDSNQEDLNNLVKQIKNYLDENFKKFVDSAFTECNINDEKYKELAYYQIQNAIEFFWAATELRDGYNKSRQELEDYIGYLKDSRLRKDTRYQGNVLISPQNPKEPFDEFQKKDNYEDYCRGAYTCTVCGENTIIGATKEDYRGDNFWNRLWKNGKFKRGERLCGFCIAKRFLRDYLNKKPFPSTSEIAATYFKKQLMERQDLVTRLFDVFKQVIDKLPEGNPVSALREKLSKITDQKSLLTLDGEWFMVDTWKNPNNYAEYDIDENTGRNIASELEKIYSENSLFPYEMYAILKLDGDNMGAKISKLDKEGHKKLSILQMAFTHQVSEIIKEHYGAPIYIGGDDVMAFLPVEHIFQCAKKIRDKIQEEMREFRNSLPNGEKYDFTLTGSVLIAHHLLPLRFVLTELYELERETKKVDGKDSIGIKSIKHSMSSEKIILKWSKIEKFKNVRDIPKSFVYQLSNISHILPHDNFQMKKAIIKSLLKGKIQRTEIDSVVDSLLEIDEKLSLDQISSFLRLNHSIQRGH